MECQLCESRLTVWGRKWIELRKNNILCDIILKVNNKEWNAHKLIIIAGSEWAHLRFNEPSRELILCSNYVSEESFDEILCYLYCGSIILSEKNLENILSSAHYLRIECLIKSCIAFMKEILKTNNLVSLINLSLRYDLKEFWDYGFHFIILNFNNAVKEDNLIELPQSFLLDLFKSDKLIVKEESVLFGFLIKLNSFGLAGQMADHIRMTLLPTHLHIQAFNLMSMNSRFKYMEFMRRSEDCQITVEDEILQEHQIQRFYSTNPIFIKGNYLNKNCVFKYTPRTRKFRLILNPEFFICDSSFAILKNYCYILGGRSSNFSGPVSTFHRYNLSNLDYDNLKPIYAGLHSMAVAKGDEEIFLSGGCGGGFRSQVFKYSLDNDNWIELAVMPEERSDHTMVLHDNSLYVFGGRTHLTYGYSIIRYDPRVKSWAVITPPQSYIYGLAACSTTEGILLAGGSDGSSTVGTVKLFDPRFNNFLYRKPLIKPLEFGGLIRNGVLTYMLGCSNFEGWDFDSRFSISIYSSKRNHWMTLPESCVLEGPISVSTDN